MSNPNLIKIHNALEAIRKDASLFIPHGEAEQIIKEIQALREFRHSRSKENEYQGKPLAPIGNKPVSAVFKALANPEPKEETKEEKETREKIKSELLYRFFREVFGQALGKASGKEMRECALREALRALANVKVWKAELTDNQIRFLESNLGKSNADWLIKNREEMVLSGWVSNDKGETSLDPSAIKRLKFEAFKGQMKALEAEMGETNMTLPDPNVDTVSTELRAG